MGNAHRNALSTVIESRNIKHASHAGLLLSRYLEHSVNDEQGFSEAKRSLFDVAISAYSKNSQLYELALARWRKYINRQNATCWRIYKTKSRLVVGLGTENVLESGIALHHTYGVPYIPGAALKGLASHYCDQVWGKSGNGEAFALQGDYHNALFGTTDESGYLIFHDAWWVPGNNVTLVRDIMTPHHKDYYSNNNVAPTDFDDPNPISFLTTTGKFHISVSCLSFSDQGKKWAQLAMDCISEALENQGIGAKTNAGYGRMTIDDSDESMPMGERLLSEVKKLSAKNLAKALGRDWKKTKNKYGESLSLYIELVLKYHGGMVRSWQQEEGNKQKAYKCLFENRNKTSKE